MPLQELFEARHREIEARLGEWRPDFSELNDLLAARVDLARPTTELLRRALGLKSCHPTSWLPGTPLAALLVAGRRITVDIAPAFLSSRRSNFGLSDQAMIDFGKAGMLLFNIRDYDPTAPVDVKRIKAAEYEHPHWSAFVERLMEEAWDSVYFLAALRPRIFDSIPELRIRTPRPKPTLQSWAALARRDLGVAGAASKIVPAFEADAIRAEFRGERADPAATDWHWAYVQSVSRFVDPEFAKFIKSEYDALAGADEHISEAARLELGRRFLHFQTRMRFAHLVYSAPLSSSFGGPYAYSLGDDHVFMQAVERQFRWTEETPFDYDTFDDDLLDLMQDLQTGQLRTRFAERLNGRNWERLRSLGTEVYARTEPRSYFEHYEEPENRAELIDYWLEQVERPAHMTGLSEEVDALLRQDEIEPRRLFDLAAAVQETRMARNAALSKWTEGYQIVLTATPGLRLTQEVVTGADPKLVNLIMRAMVWLGLRRRNQDIAVGLPGDHERMAYGGGRNFRDRPR